MTYREVVDITGLSRSTIKRGVREWRYSTKNTSQMQSFIV